MTHTATAEGGFDSRGIDAGKSWQFTAAATGTYPYVCTFHPTMKATLHVRRAAPGAARADRYGRVARSPDNVRPTPGVATLRTCVHLRGGLLPAMDAAELRVARAA